MAPGSPSGRTERLERRYVRDLRAPEWGLGVVLGDRGRAWDAFFENGRRRQVDKETSAVEAMTTDGRGAASPLLEAAASVPYARWTRAHHNVYVVELEPEVAALPDFSAANPSMIAGGLCLYVGLTGLTPEKRFRNHRRGRKAARFVRRYGKRLLPALYRQYNPVPFEVGAVLEPWLAERLRERRFGVWQN
jgi:hypothetical protein